MSGSPRVLWLGLVGTPERQPYDSATWQQILVAALNRLPGSRSWLILESEQGDLPVYDAETGALPALLRECEFMEYYVVDQRFSLLVADTDHNEILSVMAVEPR